MCEYALTGMRASVLGPQIFQFSQRSDHKLIHVTIIRFLFEQLPCGQRIANFRLRSWFQVLTLKTLHLPLYGTHTGPTFQFFYAGIREFPVWFTVAGCRCWSKGGTSLSNVHGLFPKHKWWSPRKMVTVRLILRFTNLMSLESLSILLSTADCSVNVHISCCSAVPILRSI